MSSAQLAGLKGKQRISAALANGELLAHPFKLPQFCSEKVKGISTSQVVPGNILEEVLCDECAVFIGWMRTKNCTSKQNNGYVTKCDCRANIRDGDVFNASVAMATFSMSQRGKDVRLQDHIN